MNVSSRSSLHIRKLIWGHLTTSELKIKKKLYLSDPKYNFLEISLKIRN